MPYKDPEKRREYQKKYRQENKEKLREYESKRCKTEKRKALVKKYCEENREEILETKKKYRQENKEGIKKYREENKEKIGESKKKWYEENREEILETKKKYYEENRDSIIAKNTEYKRKRYHTDPCYKLRQNVKDSIRNALKGGKGGQSFLPYVDWTMEELKEHLESQFEDWMTWDNHGVLHPTEKRWQIDHIIPQSVLLEGVISMDDPKFRECWALENLRPLEARENLLKGSKIL